MSRASSNGSGPLDRGSAGTPELFVYGTLGLEAVVECLLDRIPASAPATAPGWRAAKLPDRPYPGLVADESAAAPGRVFTDLSVDEWSTLDAFEDPTYTLAPVPLSTGRHGLAYIWPAGTLAETWSLESLDANEMEEYLERVRGWRDWYDATAGQRPD